MKKIKVLKTNQAYNEVGEDIANWMISEEAQDIDIIMVNATSYIDSYNNPTIITYILYKESNADKGIEL